MTPSTYSLRQAAERCGVSFEHFRKAWPQWSRDRRFPQPFHKPPVANYAWDRAAVDEWVMARSRALGEAAPPPFLEEVRAANDAFRDPTLRGGRIIAERVQLARILKGAAHG